MYKKNDIFNKWAKFHHKEWLAEKLDKELRTIYYYLDGKRCPSKDTMKRIYRLSKGDVPIESWF